MAITSGVNFATLDTKGVLVIVADDVEDVLGLGGELRLRGGEFDGEMHMGIQRGRLFGAGLWRGSNSRGRLSVAQAIVVGCLEEFESN